MYSNEGHKKSKLFLLSHGIRKIKDQRAYLPPFVRILYVNLQISWLRT